MGCITTRVIHRKLTFFLIFFACFKHLKCLVVLGWLETRRNQGIFDVKYDFLDVKYDFLDVSYDFLDVN